MSTAEHLEQWSDPSQTLLDLVRMRAGTGTFPRLGNDPAQVAANDEAAETYLEWQRSSKGAGLDTVSSYAGVLAKFLDECAQGRPFDVLQPEEIEAWLNRPRAGRAMGRIAAPATRSRDLTIVRGFYAWMTARGWTTRNVPALCVAPPVRNKQPRPVTDAQWVSTYPSLDTTGRICMGLMFYCGLRRAEVTSLRGDQFAPTSGMLVGFVRKGGGDDTFPYREVLGIYADRMPHLLCGRTPDSIAGEWEHLARHKKHNRLVDFPPDGMNHRFQRWCGGTFTPHQLRHSAATNLLRAGLPLDMVAWLLNHSDPAMTMRYVKQSGSRLREWRSGR